MAIEVIFSEMICLFVRREKNGAKTFDKMLCDDDVKRHVTRFFPLKLQLFTHNRCGNFLIEID